MKAALITGGSRGIGRGIVLALAERGWAVGINYRQDREAAEATAELAKKRGAAETSLCPADASDPTIAESLIQQVRERFGRLDLLVCNAGVAPLVRKDILDTEVSDWDRALDINCRGPFFLAQAAAKKMLTDREKGIGNDHQIHFITSISSAMASVNRGEYCVAKAGLSMVARLFAIRLASIGIRVFEIRPGIIETDMTTPVKAQYDQRIADGLVPMNRWGQPEDIGRMVSDLADGGMPYATGSILTLDGGLSLPRL